MSEFDLGPEGYEPPAGGAHELAATEPGRAGDVAFQPLASAASSDAVPDLTPVLDLPVEVAVEVGRTTMTIRETLALGPGSIVSLNRMAGEPVDLLVNGKRIARGEVVVIDEEFGLRITEVLEARGDGQADRPAA